MSAGSNTSGSLVIVAGLSGAGRSTALNAFLDLGFYTIDNLPVALLEILPAHIPVGERGSARTALTLDLNSTKKVQDLLASLERLAATGRRAESIFVDCDSAKIVSRYSETRRPHPGFNPQRDRTLADAIQHERDVLAGLKEKANFVLDTTRLNIHDLRREIKKYVDTLGCSNSGTVRINFLSFGFKHGAPIDCDLVIDVRFLPNPYFVSELREQTGLDKSVREFVCGQKDSVEFLQRYAELLQFLLPRYVFEGKSYLNIGVGCTGGKHRSVTIAEELAKSLDGNKYIVSVKHRDIVLGGEGPQQ